MAPLDIQMRFIKLVTLPINFSNITMYYYMAGSAIGQDEPNPVSWLATRAGNMVLSCPLGIASLVLAKPKLVGVIFWPCNKSFIDQGCSVKMAWYWPRFFCVFVSVHKNAKENLANIQPSWIHARSIMHTYFAVVFPNFFFFCIREWRLVTPRL